MDPRVRHAVATAFKAAAIQHFQKSIRAMNDGCGWHGYFEHNQLLQLEVRYNSGVILRDYSLIMPQLEFRAVSTAEGDIRVLAIRTFLVSFQHAQPMLTNF
jgi:hypothetical protein